MLAAAHEADGYSLSWPWLPCPSLQKNHHLHVQRAPSTGHWTTRASAGAEPGERGRAAGRASAGAGAGERGRGRAAALRGGAGAAALRGGGRGGLARGASGRCTRARWRQEGCAAARQEDRGLQSPPLSRREPRGSEGGLGLAGGLSWAGLLPAGFANSVLTEFEFDQIPNII